MTLKIFCNYTHVRGGVVMNCEENLTCEIVIIDLDPLDIRDTEYVIKCECGSSMPHEAVGMSVLDR